MEYWQVSAGSDGRDYSRYFLNYGIAFVGTDGDPGFSDKVQLGDIMVLKRGLSEVVAAGVVVEREGKFKGSGDKEWLLDFDGWQLDAYWYVDWHVPPGGMVAFTDGLKMTRMQRLPQPKHQDIANELIRNTQRHPREAEPVMPSIVEVDEILKLLISEGVRPGAADTITDTLRKIRLLANYYYEKCGYKEIREHEARTFLVIPFFLALGWAEQQLKIELPCPAGKIDIACFGRPYHQGSRDCVLIVETKDFSSGLDYAPEQGHNYAHDFPACKVVVVTNGHCYKSYQRRDDGSFSTQPDAYLNLRDPRVAYPLDPQNVRGALHLLKYLLPRSLETVS